MPAVYDIHLHGTSELISKLNGIARQEVIIKSLDSGGLLLAGWSKKNRLSGPRPKYLGVVSGRLRSSIASGKTQKRGNEYTNRIGTNVKYAPFHEYGTRYLRKRPFLSPAIEDQKNQRSILDILKKNIDEALEGK